MKKRAQSSIEFLSTFAIGFTIIIVLSALFLAYTEDAKNSLNRKQIDKIGTELMDNIGKIYFLGNGNRITIKTNFPEGIENLTIHYRNDSGTEYNYLNFTYYLEGELISGLYQADETYIRFNCTRCNHEVDIAGFNFSDHNGGPKTIKIESKGDWVNMDFVVE